MRTAYPDRTHEATWVDLLTIGANGEEISYADLLVDSCHARPMRGVPEFDWGEGVGSFSDRRRADHLERKRAARGISRSHIEIAEGRTAGTAPGGNRRSANNILNESGGFDDSLDVDGNQSYWYDDDDDADDYEVNVPQDTAHCLNSCGESADESDIE